jgi:ATP-dependent helicase HrpA
MLLQAREEGALTEVLIIAAGLSIQDPRERPLEQKDAAEAAHRRFQDPRSDFLTLLNIWHAYHDQWEALKTQNQMRKFCKAHFLSFVRLREWRDVHAELEEAVAELGELPPASAPSPGSPNAAGQSPASGIRHPASGIQTSASDFPPRYAAIHRSILTGLWGHVLRREDRNLYRAAGGRQVMVFPGSGLFAKGAAATAARTGRASLPGQSPPNAAQPEWLVAGEIVETSRPFARTVAAIDPAWIIELAPHLARTTHDQARWEPAAGRVLARERVLLRGLVLRERVVGYGAVNPAEATALFIRAALVDYEPEPAAEPKSSLTTLQLGGARLRRARLLPEVPSQSDATSPAIAPPARARRFLEHNRRLREKIELWQTRLSHRVVPDLDEALVGFYAARLSRVSSWPDLDRALKAAPPDFLCASAADLLGGHAAAFKADAFPDELTLAGRPVPVAYAYAPGREHDGVTLRLAVPLAELVDAAQLDWLVPALREERIAHLLRELPKALRRPLMPLNAAAHEITAHVAPAGGDFLAALSAFVKRRFGVDIPVPAWPVGRLPDHLRPRVELVAGDGRLLAAGRDLAALREQARQHRTPAETEAWQQAAQRWERYGLREWNFGDLPESITVADSGGLPLRAWPGLHLEDGGVHLRLFREAAEALAATRAAVPRLAEIVLQRELAAVQKDLRSLRAHGVLYATLGSADELLETAWENLRRHLLPAPDPAPRTAAAFTAYLERIRAGMPGLVARLAAAVDAILQARQEVLLCRRPFAGMEAELNALVPARFLALAPFERLSRLPRYLQALRVRAERAALNPAKDAAKVARVRPYAEALRQLAAGAKSVAARAAWHRLRWLIEEFKVSVFAPELGTAEKVSPHRLDEAVAELRRAVG